MTRYRVTPSAEVERHTDGQAVVLHVGGEIDLGTVAVLEAGVEAALAEAVAHHTPTVVIDLEHVTFFASVGLVVVIRAQNQTGWRGLRLVVSAPPTGSVRRVIEVTDLTTVLTVVESVACAGAPDVTGRA